MALSLAIVRPLMALAIVSLAAPNNITHSGFRNPLTALGTITGIYIFFILTIFLKFKTSIFTCGSFILVEYP